MSYSWFVDFIERINAIKINFRKKVLYIIFLDYFFQTAACCWSWDYLRTSYIHTCLDTCTCCIALQVVLRMLSSTSRIDIVSLLLFFFSKIILLKSRSLFESDQMIKVRCCKSLLLIILGCFDPKVFC